MPRLKGIETRLICALISSRSSAAVILNEVKNPSAAQISPAAQEAVQPAALQAALPSPKSRFCESIAQPLTLLPPLLLTSETLKPVLRLCLPQSSELFYNWRFLSLHLASPGFSSEATPIPAAPPRFLFRSRDSYERAARKVLHHHSDLLCQCAAAHRPHLHNRCL